MKFLRNIDPIEALIVVAIIGILAAIALTPHRKANEQGAVIDNDTYYSNESIVTLGEKTAAISIQKHKGLWKVEATSTDFKYRTNNQSEDISQAISQASANIDTYNNYLGKDQLE